MSPVDPAPRLDAGPVVSVIMANFNGAAHLADAIESVQRQTLRDLELIVVDDASTDSSVDLVQQKMAHDPRIRLLQSARNGGPATARNRAIEAAKGAWIAIMDSDDLMHPERLARLTELARHDDIDIAADELVEFLDDPSGSRRILTPGRHEQAATTVDIIDYIDRNHFYAAAPPLGYLKPLFRASLFARTDHRYDETLRITEDFDLVLRLLHSESRMRIYPLPLYFYRKHPDSISHRLNVAALEAIRDSSLRFLAGVPIDERRLGAALEARLRSVETALAYERLIVAIKAANWTGACRIAVARPQALYLLRLPIWRRFDRMTRIFKSGGTTIAPMTPPALFPMYGLPAEMEKTVLPSAKSVPEPKAESLTVCICTFRRPSVLRAIASVAAQRLPDGDNFRLMVIDNDDTPAAKALIDEYCAAKAVALDYHHVPGRNISIARNAALEKADSRWLAFMDDDEYASSEWLLGLISSRDGAAAVFGPCQAIYSQGTARWIRDGDYHSNRIVDEQRTMLTGYTSNVLIDMDVVRRHNLRFDPAFGRTGGEDTIFFYALHAKGGVLHYARNAIVYEDVAQARIGFRWIATRKYRSGQVYAKLFHDFDRSKYRKNAATAPLKIAVCAGAFVATAFKPSHAMWWLMRGIFHIGSLSFVLGASVHEEYAGKSLPSHADA